MDKEEYIASMSIGKRGLNWIPGLNGETFKIDIAFVMDGKIQWFTVEEAEKIINKIKIEIDEIKLKNNYI